ncbi:hypothetical protein F5B21DRAFT_473103 [Xylaria acuta]|nr:hypothetical protein F5B21DRAFT_473103 [Xylaria acuta]
MPYFSWGKSFSDEDFPGRIITAIKESRLLCNSFDILRIGDALLQDCELPVKLFIKIEPGRVRWVNGMNFARRCRLKLAV